MGASNIKSPGRVVQSSGKSLPNWASGLLLLAVVALSGAAGYSLGARAHDSAPSAATSIDDFRDDLSGDSTHAKLLLPRPELSAAQVVGIQLDALARCSFDPDAAEQVFAFASPSNQAVTGPLENFAAMLSLSPYEALVNRTGVTVGAEVRKGQLATLLVTTVDDAGHISLFRFLLSRHPIDGAECWVTDAVQCIAWRAEMGESPHSPLNYDDHSA